MLPIIRFLGIRYSHETLKQFFIDVNKTARKVWQESSNRVKWRLNDQFNDEYLMNAIAQKHFLLKFAIL